MRVKEVKKTPEQSYTNAVATVNVVLRRDWILPNGRILEAREEPYEFPKKWFHKLPKSAFVMPPPLENLTRFSTRNVVETVEVPEETEEEKIERAFVEGHKGVPGSDANPIIDSEMLSNPGPSVYDSGTVIES